MRRFLAALALALVVALDTSSIRPATVHAQPANEPFTFTWEQHSPVVNPPARSRASITYDGTTGTILLFGGNDGTNSLGDTWRWADGSWTVLQPTISPPRRESASMAYLEQTGTVVLFGGQVSGPDGPRYLDDTWSWDGQSWTEVTPNASPPARSGAGLAYDGVTQTLLLFGGADTQPLGDTWRWDGSSWTQYQPATSPPARLDASMIWHSPTGTVLLFGGNGLCDPNPCGDTWVWYGGSGGSWGQITPSTAPPARYGAGMVLKGGPAGEGAGVVVLFGGFTVLGPRPGTTTLGGTQTFGDTWLWNGEGWEEAAVTPSPQARAFAAMVANDTDGSIVLFGGSGVQGAETVMLDDTWLLTGSPRSPQD